MAVRERASRDPQPLLCGLDQDADLVVDAADGVDRGVVRVAAARRIEAVAEGRLGFLDSQRRGSVAAEKLAEVQAASGGRLAALCDLYADRIAACAVDPPAADWDGVYRALQK